MVRPSVHAEGLAGDVAGVVSQATNTVTWTLPQKHRYEIVPVSQDIPDNVRQVVLA
jgi:hypothetical protein